LTHAIIFLLQCVRFKITFNQENMA
jgi:hypothetical protein